MSNSKTQEYDSNQSRCDFLKRLTVFGIGIFLSPFLWRCARKNGIPTLNLWGTGTLDIGKNWDRVIKDIGVKIEFEDNNNDPGPVLAKLRAGEAKTRHLGGLQGGAEKELAGNKLAIPWDLNLIPNYKKLWPWARDISYTKVGEQTYGIPSVINADSMIYLPEFTGKIDSYSAVFDPKYRGKTAMEDAWINSVIFTAIYLKENKLEYIEDPGNLTKSELKSVMAFLKEKAKEGQFRKLWRGWEDGVELIASKQVWVMTGWEPIVFEVKRRGVQAEYAVPREGYEGWSNDLILYPGVETDGLYEKAHQFVNWELEGFYGCALASMRGYVVPTDDSIRYAELHPEDFLPSEVQRIVQNVKRKFFEMKGNVYWQNVRPDEYQEYEEEWAEFRQLVAQST